MTFVAGVLGALAPELIRWRRIARRNVPGKARTPRLDFLVLTALYALLAGFFATLIDPPTAYAAFISGLTFEYAVAGALRGSEEQKPEIEELGEEPASQLDLLVAMLRLHASYLTNG
ncbi:MAG: hypothetical protein QOE56_1828 [Solirubrobacterales bacterium]|nr:hypothetical protein [Solirubrobacterales bacterium]